MYTICVYNIGIYILLVYHIIDHIIIPVLFIFLWLEEISFTLYSLQIHLIFHALGVGILFVI